jgi:type IV pilus assembly PilX-like protein
MRRTFSSSRRRERGAALVVAILVLAILTVIGIALMLITSTESRIAANEWSVNRGFYSSDAGLRWASVQMNDPMPYMDRAEFDDNGVMNDRDRPGDVKPFGTILFRMPSHKHAAGSFFTGDVGEDDIDVRVGNPSLVGRRPYAGGIINEKGEKAQYTYSYEIRSGSGSRDPLLQYSKSLVADIELGPLPAQVPF